MYHQFNIINKYLKFFNKTILKNLKQILLLLIIM